MFFIGGFNSIIPYIVYLTLIWTFMILSFGGRIAAILHKHSDKEFTSEKVISKESDHHYLNCYQYESARPSQDEVAATVPDPPVLSWSPNLIHHIRIRSVSPPLPSREPFSFLFRGPPLFS